MARSARLRTPLRGAAAALALAASLGLAACGSNGSGSGSGSDADAGPPVRGGTLKVSFFPDNPTFSCVDPFQTYWIEHRSVIRNYADSLTDQDPRTGKIVPWLADRWEISSDGKAYTFHLRSGVTFSDGTPLDAAAVKANFDGFLATVKATQGAAFGASYILGLEKATVVDPSTVKLTFSTPNSSFLQATSTTNLAILEPKAFDETPEQRCLGKGLIGSGPFTLQSYSPNKSLVLKKRAGYRWASPLSKNKGDAYLDEVDYNYVAEDSVRTGNLVSGAIDVAWPRNPFTPEDQELIKRSGDTVISRSLPGPAYDHYANVGSGRPLADLDVRRALYKALDLKTYAQTVFGSNYPVVQGAFDATTPYFSSQASKLAYDPDGAGKLLDGAGWTLGADGYRHKGGKTLELSLPITQFSAGSELIQDQFKKVGIKLDLNTITAAEQPEVLTNGDYDLTNNYFTRADPGALQFILDPDLSNSKALATNAASPEVTAQIKSLFRKAIQTTDESQSKEAYAELQSLLIDQGVVFPIFERLQFAGLGKDVHGFQFTSESFQELNGVWKSK